jgi:hypothetical protein
MMTCRRRGLLSRSGEVGRKQSPGFWMKSFARHILPFVGLAECGVALALGALVDLDAPCGLQR